MRSDRSGQNCGSRASRRSSMSLRSHHAAAKAGPVRSRALARSRSSNAPLTHPATAGPISPGRNGPTGRTTAEIPPPHSRLPESVPPSEDSRTAPPDILHKGGSGPPGPGRLHRGCARHSTHGFRRQRDDFELLADPDDLNRQRLVGSEPVEEVAERNAGRSGLQGSRVKASWRGCPARCRTTPAARLWLQRIQSSAEGSRTSGPTRSCGSPCEDVRASRPFANPHVRPDIAAKSLHERRREFRQSARAARGAPLRGSRR